MAVINEVVKNHKLGLRHFRIIILIGGISANLELRLRHADIWRIQGEKKNAYTGPPPGEGGCYRPPYISRAEQRFGNRFKYTSSY